MIIRFIYFRPNGDYFSEAQYWMAHPSGNLLHMIAQLNSEARLPGIINGKWEGYILIQSDQNAFKPQLIDISP